MRKSETYRNEIKSYIVRTGMESQRSQSLRQAQAWLAPLRRSGRAGGRAGV